MPRSPSTYELNEGLREYQAGWQVARRLIYEGRSWSGHERNCVFLNTADNRFGNISAVSGLDFIDDGRAVAVVDWDHDGDLDLWLRNRTGPRLRLMKNQTANNRSFVAFRLEGTACNKDAIGARVEVYLPKRKLVQTLVAGDGFISQSSKWLHFGVGDAKQILKVIVRWPGSSTETFDRIDIGKRYHLVQDSHQAIALNARQPVQLAASTQHVPAPPAESRLLLAKPFPLPSINYSEMQAEALDSQIVPFRANPSANATLINLWASWCVPCHEELQALQNRQSELQNRGIDVLAFSVDAATTDADGNPSLAIQLAEKMNFATGFVTAETLDKIQILMDSLFAREVPLGVPCSLLLDGDGKLSAFYAGAIEVDRLFRDFDSLSAPLDQRRRQTVPFAGRWYSRPTGVSLDKIADSYLEEFPDDAVRFYEMAAQEHAATSPPDYAEGRAQWMDRRFRLNLALGFLYRKQDRPDEALKHALVASETRPDDAGTWQLIGNLYRDRQDIDAGIEAFARANQLLPNHLATLHLLAELLEQADRPDEAVGYVQRLRELRPDAPVLLQLGRLLGKMGRYDEAEVTLRKAISERPEDVAARVNLALVLQRQNKFDGAIALLLEVVRSSPNDADAHAKLGSLYRQQGDVAAATRHLRHATRLRPKNWRMQFDLGDLLDADGHTGEAIQVYEQAWKLNPKFPLAANNIAWILATHADSKLRDGQRAVELATQAVKLAKAKDPGLFDTLAAAQAETGAFQQAVESIQTAIRLAESKNKNEDLVQRYRDRLKLYQNSRPYRQPTPEL